MLEVPGWLRNVLEHAGHFSEAGMAGIMRYPRAFNVLGEAVAQGAVSPEALEQFLLDASRSKQPSVAIGEQEWLSNPQTFWSTAWHEILRGTDPVVRECGVLVPSFPTLKAKTRAAIAGGLGTWIPIYLPKDLTEADYPADFIKPQWGQHLTVSDIQRRPLPGRWVLVETAQKPDYVDSQGYGNGDDPLAKELGLASRFHILWDTLHETHHPAIAKLLGLSKKAVRSPTAEEWNLIGNLFLWLNANRNMTLPDLGSTNSWEWTENTYGVGSRLVAGYRAYGGLADVRCRWRDDAYGRIGFRVLAVLPEA